MVTPRQWRVRRFGRTFRRTGVVLFALHFVACADNSTVVGIQSALSYVLSCQKSHGGFGPQLQPYADLEWTWHAVNALSVLGAPVPRADECGRFLSTLSARQVLPAREHFAATSTRILLGETPSVQMSDGLRSLQRPDGGWPSPSGGTTLSSTYWAIETIHALKSAPVDGEAAGRFLVERLHSDGHFDETLRTRAFVGKTGAGDESESTDVSAPKGHVWLTYCGVTALTRLGYEVPWKGAVTRWLQSCQQTDGGFSWHPGPDSVGGSDLWYTWLAIAALRTLGSAPSDSVGVARFINACQNADGGFGDRPGWSSRLPPTDYALMAAQALSGDAARVIQSKAAIQRDGEALASLKRMRIYHLYEGPMTRADTLRRSSAWSPGLPIYRTDGDLEVAETYLTAAALAVGDCTLKRYVCQLRYPVFLSSLRDGGVVKRSVGFWVERGPQPDTIRAIRGAWVACTESPRDTAPWHRYGEHVLRPLTARGLICYERIGTGDQVLDYLIMDELLAQPQECRAVAGAIPDGTDLVRANPHLERLVGRVPLVVPFAAPNAGPSDRARLVWLGGSGDMSDLREALREGRTACAVREDGAPGGVVLYGEPDVVAALWERYDEVRWWRSER